MKILIFTTLVALLMTGCAALAPQQTASATLTGTWDFELSWAGERQFYRFTLTNSRAETCKGQVYYRVRVRAAPEGSVYKPAYRYENGELRILLFTDICDDYKSFSGKVSGSTFDGARVFYNIMNAYEQGKVTGTRRR
ncbi:hypothetical protein [Alkalisalibacterium limincola]|uniref:Lipoprotein n=1 Tax=Alkalisalibacterium limincola TaxID=2699169 RepID=A0A5C8KVQ4_9GAMM|nr:hypothetical protein [Alkalisalibacterium limincola]TXK64822.1 hypothetical protein FU658_02975 [Alkalisalibacterium limincola]